MNDVSSALARARAFSGFLARTIERNPQISGLLESGSVEEAYALAQAAGEGAAGTGQALRWRRNAIALVTAIADLSGAWVLDRKSVLEVKRVSVCVDIGGRSLLKKKKQLIINLR